MKLLEDHADATAELAEHGGKLAGSGVGNEPQLVDADFTPVERV